MLRNFMTAFHYKSGEAVQEGDIVAVVGKRATVESVFPERTSEARDFACFETGGLLLKFEDGDLQVWRWVNEDLEFQGRANAHK